jgi:hypothetical protein
MLQIPDKWHRSELLLFSVATILNMIPFLSTHYFPSLDGASHLSNANIIAQLVFHHNDFFASFFSINPEPVPNWISHGILALLSLVMPLFMAEKILLFILLAGLPFAFRSLVHAINPRNLFLAFLIFPFSHPMFLFFGFYNFCFGGLFLILTLNFWVRQTGKPLQIRGMVMLFLLITATWFSHIAVYGLLLLLLGLHVMISALTSRAIHETSIRTIVNRFIYRALALVITAGPTLVLFAWFFISRPETREITYIPRRELLHHLLTMRPLISLNTAIEGRYTVILAILAACLALAGLAFLIYKSMPRVKIPSPLDRQESLRMNAHFWWFLSGSIVLLLLYFVMPDAYGSASYTNLRVGFIFYLVIFLWLATLPFKRWIGILTVLVALTSNFLLISFYNKEIKNIAPIAADCAKAAETIKPNTLVLPINCIDNWFTGHFTDYVATVKPVIMAYNYESDFGYFPVVWNTKTRQNFYLGNPDEADHFLTWEIVKGNPTRPLDYVFILGSYDPEKDWFFGQLHRILTTHFELTYSGPHCKLYTFIE